MRPIAELQRALTARPDYRGTFATLTKWTSRAVRQRAYHAGVFRKFCPVSRPMPPVPRRRARLTCASLVDALEDRLLLSSAGPVRVIGDDMLVHPSSDLSRMSTSTVSAKADRAY